MDSNPDSDHLSHVDCDPDSNPDSGPGARVNVAYDLIIIYLDLRKLMPHSELLAPRANCSFVL